MNDIVFQKQQGDLSRPLAGEDHFSGLIFYCATKPTGWATQSVCQVTSINNAVSLGIAQNSANFGVMYYQIGEFFRINPGATLYVGIFSPPVSPAVYDYMEIKTLQQFTLGKVRQVGVFLTDAFATGIVTLMQAVSDALDAIHMPIEILMTADFHSVTDLTTLTSLRLLTAAKVSVILGQDGANAGAALATSTSKSVACLGAALGAVSLAKVNECIGWVEKFNMALVELDTPAMANGQLISALDPNLLNTLNTQGYIFLRKHVGISGSYFNDSHTAIVITSDYAYIEANRTMDKAIRGVRTYVLPQLNGPVKVDASSGKLDHNTVKYIEDLANEPLIQMTRDGELSGFLAYIDPDQDVLSTSQLEIQITNVPLGVSRNIIIKIGFATSV